MSVQSVKNKPILIGLTGGIASGKSTVANYFRQLNIPVIDSDLIVRKLWKENQHMVQEIEASFGFIIKTKADRTKLSRLIFKDEQKRQMLNHIVHPYVFDQIEKEKKEFSKQNIIVIDMPLLIEVNYQNQVDYVCVVYVDYETQLKRLVSRDSITVNSAKRKMSAQLCLNEKAKKAHFVIDNRGTKEETYEQVDSFLRGIEHEK
jgi:dephospho-CoA kinase